MSKNPIVRREAELEKETSKVILRFAAENGRVNGPYWPSLWTLLRRFPSLDRI